jgi:anti-sigma factor RsiW
LKAATRQAGYRFAPSPEALVRLTSQAKKLPPRQQKVIPFRFVAWGSIAVLLLLAVSLGSLRQSNRNGALSAELVDQHLASLSDSSSPQVISTDRHTVKPWFQGKLPFSFNLPEPTALPAETVLQGADFTYVEGRPAALLRFTIRKHRASVFITQGGQLILPGLQNARSGFNISQSQASGLELAGVSDVNRSDLDALVRTLASVQ